MCDQAWQMMQQLLPARGATGTSHKISQPGRCARPAPRYWPRDLGGRATQREEKEMAVTGITRHFGEPRDSSSARYRRRWRPFQASVSGRRRTPVSEQRPATMTGWSSLITLRSHSGSRWLRRIRIRRRTRPAPARVWPGRSGPAAPGTLWRRRHFRLDARIFNSGGRRRPANPVTQAPPRPGRFARPAPDYQSGAADGWVPFLEARIYLRPEPKNYLAANSGSSLPRPENGALHGNLGSRFPRRGRGGYRAAEV